MAAITYVYAAHLRASIAIGAVFESVTPVFLSHAIALVLALTSTGRVTKLKSVVSAKSPIPNQRRLGKVFAYLKFCTPNICSFLTTM